MSIEHNDEQVEEVVGQVEEQSVDGADAVEVDADSLAAAAHDAGITDADIEAAGESESQDEPVDVVETDGQPEVEAVDEETQEDSPVENNAEGGETIEAGSEEAVVDGTEEPAEGSEEEMLEDEQEVEIVTSVCTDEGVEVTVESVIESILFASDEPITPNRMVNIIEAGSVKQVRDCVKSLNEKYEENNMAFRIERIAGGYQMMTVDAYNHWLRKMIRVRADNKLTQAALETLAIVAYKQPIIRADVEGIRGVSSGEMIRSLMYKGLVRITGRAEVLGRPMLYGTTKKFLDVFGLNSPKDLPKVDELKKPQE